MSRSPEEPEKLTEEEREKVMREALDEWQAEHIKADLEKLDWEAKPTKNHDLPI